MNAIKTLPIALLAMLLFSAVPRSEANEPGVIVVYPRFPGTEASETYTVSVNGIPIVAEKEKDISYVHFAFAGKADIVVTVREPVQSHTLSPKSYQIPTLVSDRQIAFSLTVPRKLILWKVNSLPEKLFIFADPLEDNAPDPNAAGVANLLDYGVDSSGGEFADAAIQGAIDELSERPDGGTLYVPPGRYAIKNTLYLRDKVSLYLAGGARIVADEDEDDLRLNIADVSRARLHGRGVLDRVFLRTYSSRNVEVEGIIVAPPDGGSWTWRVDDAEQISISNVKIIADYTQGGSDGIDVSMSNRVLIDDIFIYGGDDGVVVKALAEGPAVENIVTRNSVFFIDAGNGIGTETLNDLITDVIWENNDMVSVGVAARLAPYDGATIENIYYKNIRFEQIARPHPHSLGRMMDIKAQKPQYREGEAGQIRNIYFQNVSFDMYAPVSSLVKGNDPEHLVVDVTFDNFFIAGKLMRSIEDARIETNEHVREIGFSSSDPTIVEVVADELFVYREPGTRASFVVTRSGDTSAPLRVDYRIRGTAAQGVDYAQLPQHVTIPAGARSAAIEINPLQASDYSTRTVHIALQSDTTESYPQAPSFLLGPNHHAVITILQCSPAVCGAPTAQPEPSATPPTVAKPKIYLPSVLITNLCLEG
jgi:hypothetical protein